MLDGDDASLDDLDEPDWNWVEDELMVDDANDFPAVGGSDTCFDGRTHRLNTDTTAYYGYYIIGGKKYLSHQLVDIMFKIELLP